MKIEYRTKLWYNKYKYRAKFTIHGISRSYGCKTFLEYLKRIEQLIVNNTISVGHTWEQDRLTEINSIDLDAIDNYLSWRHNKKNIIIRTEGNTTAVFSNEIALLNTLEGISESVRDNMSYTEADVSCPTGIKYFTKEPRHQYRVYLRSARLGPDKLSFRDDLRDFIQRYAGTQSEMFPSYSLSKWLGNPLFRLSQWRQRYSFGHFYIEFDEPSTHALLALMFSDMIAARYKLEKRPV